LLYTFLKEPKCSESWMGRKVSTETLTLAVKHVW